MAAGGTAVKVSTVSGPLDPCCGVMVERWGWWPNLLLLVLCGKDYRCQPIQSPRLSGCAAFVFLHALIGANLAQRWGGTSLRSIWGTEGQGRLCRSPQAACTRVRFWYYPGGNLLLMVSLVNSHINATRIGWHLREVDLRCAPGLPPGWRCMRADLGAWGQLVGLLNMRGVLESLWRVR